MLKITRTLLTDTIKLHRILAAQILPGCSKSWRNGGTLLRTVRDTDGELTHGISHKGTLLATWYESRPENTSGWSYTRREAELAAPYRKRIDEIRTILDTPELLRYTTKR